MQALINAIQCNTGVFKYISLSTPVYGYLSESVKIAKCWPYPRIEVIYACRKWQFFLSVFSCVDKCHSHAYQWYHNHATCTICLWVSMCPKSCENRVYQWSISTIICICTIAYEDYIIYSSVCVICHRYYVVPSRICHIWARLRLMKPFNANWDCSQCYFLKLPPSVNFSLFKRDFVWQYWLLLYINTKCH